jgi:predicted patatin/cPLA2 family phospholipase
MAKIGLVLEGGGFRGIYSAGILDYFLEQEWHFPYIIGVSMGSCNGANYISKQKKRSVEIPYEYIEDPRYISYKNLITQGNLFGMDFIFHKIPDQLNKFDYETFRKSEQEFVITTMDVDHGGSRFFSNKELNDAEFNIALKASCSLPFISKMVNIRDGKYLDGGLSDSIPIKKAFDDGVDKVIALVTREKGYRKNEKETNIGRWVYRKYPHVIKAIHSRSVKYNQELEYMEKMASLGKVFPIYPKVAIDLGRTEKNKDKLMQCYLDGYERAKELHEEIAVFAEVENSSKS